jgi:hypothetical protein
VTTAAEEKDQHSMNEYLQACRRFWWVILIGGVVALAAGYEVAKHHKAPTYSATLKMIVDSRSRPFLRTAQTSVTAQPARTQVLKVPVKTKTGATTYKTELITVPQSPTVASQAPDTQTLVSAANLYPSLIESDAVATLREKLFGKTPGTVTADAEFSTNAPSGKFVASSFPLIDITAQSLGPRPAEKLTWDTFVAFKHWLVTNQMATAVPPSQRIQVSPLVTAKTATRTSHTHVGVAVVVLFAVLAAVVFLAIVLDKLVPRRVRKPAGDEDFAPAVPEDGLVGASEPALATPPEI